VDQGDVRPDQATRRGGTVMAFSFLQHLQHVSKNRADRWHDTGHPEAKWSLLEWAGAMCGESGEAANVAKKIKRIDSRMWNTAFVESVPSQTNEATVRLMYQDKLAREVADSILYGLLILSELNVDAEEILRTVFNEKSIDAGFPERV
jgi:NTP pyrophosphatase (non-canonical NTP hydrolase)